MDLNLQDFVLLLCAIILVMLHGGLLCFKSGQARTKNSAHVAMRSLLDFGLCSLIFWVFGYGFIFGDTLDGILGTGLTFSSTQGESLKTASHFLFFAFFSILPVSIFSSSVSERMSFKAYILMVPLIALIIFPLFAHWAWKVNGTEQGWLNNLGFIDFSGGTVVFSLGAWIALASLKVLGERTDNKYLVNSLRSSNLPFAVLGLFLVWAGWFCLQLGFCVIHEENIGRVIINTLLAGTSGMLISMITGYISKFVVRIDFVINGTVAGLVSVSANSNLISPGSAIFIGSIGSIVMIMTKYIIEKYLIDDTVEVTSAFLAPGIWGTLAVAIFADKELLAISSDTNPRFVVQLIGVIICGLWAYGITSFFLRTCQVFFMIRISDEDEEIGLDRTELSESHSLNELYQTMNTQSVTGNFSIRAHVEPHTEVGNIALHYNRVLESLEKMNSEIIKRKVDSHIQGELTVEAISSAKLASIGELAAGVAHEINNPLNGMINYATLALDTIDHEEKELMVEIIEEGKRIASIVENLLDFSRQKEEQPIQVQLQPILNSSISLLKNLLKKHGVKIEIEKQESHTTVLFTPGELKQIFINLISNACHALCEKYPSIKDKKIITIKTEENDQHVILSIHDHGGGIKKDNLEKVFTPFYTTKPSGEGTGLGLSICHKIMKKHHCDITIDSEENIGTTVKLLLNKYHD